jgi:hypothetical protein
VPFVRGGLWAQRIMYFSVDPGRSACLECNIQTRRLAPPREGVPDEVLVAGLDNVNRGIGPVASLMGSLVSMEALRYLTEFAPPLAAGRHRFVNLATGKEDEFAWQPWPECPVCPTAPTARRSAVKAHAVG